MGELESVSVELIVQGHKPARGWGLHAHWYPGTLYSVASHPEDEGEDPRRVCKAEKDWSPRVEEEVEDEGRLVG